MTQIFEHYLLCQRKVLGALHQFMATQAFFARNQIVLMDAAPSLIILAYQM